MSSSSSNRSSQAIVIGAGFSGIAAATELASKGVDVVVLERHNHPGGRARVFQEAGFTFDMGPSWYWMPDVFEAYFEKFGSHVNEELDLVRLDPSYKVWFTGESLDVPAAFESMQVAFESMEKGAGQRLADFMAEAKIKYDIGMSEFVWKPAHNVLEFADWKTVKQATHLSLFTSFSKHARRYFTDPRLLQIIEFPVLFLGAKPEKTPALYSLMNYADTMLGTWYPMGGMHEIVRALVRVAERHGVQFHYEQDVASIDANHGKVSGVTLRDGTKWKAETIIAAADYHHVEQHLLPAAFRRYDATYWDNRVMSPSSLLFYVGVDIRVPQLKHHNLFFDTPFGPHASTIYDEPAWPEDPLFYISAPSKTDSGVAPEGHENLFFLIPLAPGLSEEEGQREFYFNHLCDRLESHIGLDIRPHIVFKRSYAHAEFQEDYRAFKGNAYGLANTLKQTAFWKPKMKSKLPGLFFTGQLTTPGPGVPPSLISGEVAGREAKSWLKGGK
ncbi:MAG: phytoene desaturase family protein [Flavobacteriales bacterium]|jgi:phytoene desaturase